MKKLALPKPGLFDRLASKVSKLAGRPFTFFTALMIVIIWGVSGPIFEYSEVWQLVINTGTTIITFLLLFIVQSTQNRDTAALQLKLDAIIYVLTGCDNELIKAEDLTQKEIEALIERYKTKAVKHTGTPEERFEHLNSDGGVSPKPIVPKKGKRILRRKRKTAS